MGHNSAAADAFAKVVKVTNHSGLWDAELTWYWNCWGCEGDKPQWIVRCRAHLILKLLRLWRWQTTVDCEMPSSPDTEIAEVVKVTNHSGLWDAELTWYWNCWGCEGDKPQWIVRCRAHLILKLLRLWRWQTTVDCEMPSSPDTEIAEVVKVTNHSGLWDAELTWYWNCWGCEGDKPQWIVRCRAHLILTEIAEVVKMTNPSGLWDAKLAWYWQSATHWICLYGLGHSFGIHTVWPTWLWLSRFFQPKRNFFNYLVTVLWSAARSSFAHQMFLVWLLCLMADQPLWV